MNEGQKFNQRARTIGPPMCVVGLESSVSVFVLCLFLVKYVRGNL